MQGRASTMPHSSAVKQLRAEVCRSLARPGGISASSYGSRNLTDMPALCGGDRKRKKRGIRPLRSPRVTAPIFRGHILFGVPIIVRTEVLSSDMPSSAETYQILLRSSKKAPHAGRFFHTLSGWNSKTRSVCYTYCSSLPLLSSSATLRSNSAIRSSLVGLRLAWRSAREACMRALAGA